MVLHVERFSLRAHLMTLDLCNAFWNLHVEFLKLKLIHNRQLGGSIA
jgi:hypothetical protein